MNVLVIIPGSSVTSVMRVTTEGKVFRAGSGTIQSDKPLQTH
jgi:hypothetical protein